MRHLVNTTENTVYREDYPGVRIASKALYCKTNPVFQYCGVEVKENKQPH